MTDNICTALVTLRRSPTAAIRGADGLYFSDYVPFLYPVQDSILPTVLNTKSITGRDTLYLCRCLATSVPSRDGVLVGGALELER
jgi:hypothetical protein